MISLVKTHRYILSQKGLPLWMASLAVFILAAGPLHLCLCLPESCHSEMAVVETPSCTACCETEQSLSEDTITSACSQCAELDFVASTPPALSGDSTTGLAPSPAVVWIGAKEFQSRMSQMPSLLASSRSEWVPGPPPEQHSILRI